MKYRFFIIILIAGFFINAGNDEIKKWTKEKDIIVTGDNNYKELFLDEEVYKYIKNDLSDLRIINKNNEFIPYFIETGYEDKIKENKEYQAILINEQVIKSNKTENNYDYIFEFQVLSQDKELYINKQEFITSQKNYSIQIKIYGRNEKSNYRLLQQDSIYNINNMIKKEVELNDIFNYKFYKIVILNNVKEIKIDSLKLFYSTLNQQFYHFKKAKNISFETNKKGSDTVITLYNNFKLNILSIILYTEGNYNRDYSIVKDLDNNEIIKSGTLYSFINKEVKIENKKIEFYGHPVNDEKIYLIISNHDNPQIKITRIDIEYKFDKIIFEAKKNDSYKLLFENEEAGVPDYDIKSYKEYIKKEDKDLCSLSVIKDKGDKPIKIVRRNFKLIFNILLIFVSLLLIVLIMLKLFKTKK